MSAKSFRKVFHSKAGAKLFVTIKPGERPVMDDEDVNKRTPSILPPESCLTLFSRLLLIASYANTFEQFKLYITRILYTKFDFGNVFAIFCEIYNFWFS